MVNLNLFDKNPCVKTCKLAEFRLGRMITLSNNEGGYTSCDTLVFTFDFVCTSLLFCKIFEFSKDILECTRRFLNVLENSRSFLGRLSGYFYSNNDLRIKTHLKIVRNVSRHYWMNHSKVSQDTLNEYWLGLKTLRIIFLRILKSVWIKIFEPSWDGLHENSKYLKAIQIISFKLSWDA